MADAALRAEHAAEAAQLTALLRVGRPLWLHGSPGSGLAWLVRSAIDRDPTPTAQLHAAEVYGPPCLWRALDALPVGARRLLVWDAHRLSAISGLLALVARVAALPLRANVAVVFVSSHAPPAEALEGAEMLSMCVTPYSRAALIRLARALEAHVADAQHADLFALFVDTVAGSLLTGERDLAHLRRCVRLLWPAFLAPLRSGAVPAEPVAVRNSALHARISGTLTDYRARLFQRELTCSDRRRLARSARDAPLPPRDVELPHMAKLLLVAAFLAAHVPRTADSRLFSRLATGDRATRRPARPERAAAASAAAPPGPHTFKLERMRAIAVLLKGGEVEAAHNVELGSAVASLVRLGLLRYTSRSVFDEARLRCTASREFVEEQCAPVCRVVLADYLARP